MFQLVGCSIAYLFIVLVVTSSRSLSLCGVKNLYLEVGVGYKWRFGVW